MGARYFHCARVIVGNMHASFMSCLTFKASGQGLVMYPLRRLYDDFVVGIEVNMKPSMRLCTLGKTYIMQVI